MRAIKKLQLNNKKGFTLAELLVVLGITIILLGISMLAIINYTKAMKLTEMDTAAKEIFIAAQNHLTAADASGRVDSFVTENPEDSRLGSLITTYKPDDYDKTLGEEPKFDTDYRYLIYTPNNSEVLKDTFLSILLPFGAIDEEVRTGGSYVVEYCPETGDVYGVFYTDSFNLTATDIQKITKAGGRSYEDTGKDVRKNYSNGVVGYYGGAMADGLLVTEIDPVTVEIENEDVLKVKVADPNFFKDVAGSQLETNVQLKVSGKTSGKSKTLVFPLNGTNALPGADTVKSTMKYWKVSLVDANDKKKGLIYEVNLDDITQDGGHFTDLFPDFIPGEDIIIEASCASNKVLTKIQETEPVVTNSLFDSVVVGQNDNGEIASDTSATANISCSRHLENLDTNISKLPSTGTTLKTSLIRYAAVVEDFDWETYFAKNGDLKTVTPYKDSTDTTFNGLDAGTYYSIKRNELLSFNGKGHTISNIVINNEIANKGKNQNNSAGLIRSVTAEHDFTVRNLILKDCNVEAVGNAGTLIGEASGNLNLTVSNVIVTDGFVTSSASGFGSGGLIGYSNIGNSGSLNINNCGATVYSYNTDSGAAGGFIGILSGSRNNISNSYSGGHTVNGEYVNSQYNVSSAGGNAGGFIGETPTGSNVIISQCFNAASASGYYAGGFFGLHQGRATISDSYTIAKISGNVQGTLVGSVGNGSLSNTSISNSYYLEGINSTMPAFGDPKESGNAAAISYTALTTDKTPSTTAIAGEKYDNGISGVYPFSTYTKEVVKDNAQNAPGAVYYGDWPKAAHQNLDSKCMFAYRETMSDGSFRWSVLGNTILSGDGSIKEIYNDLNDAKGVYVSDYAYGMLSKSSISNGDFTKGGIPSNYDRAGEIITINGEEYYFYRYTGSEASTVTLENWKMATGSSTTTFSFNPAYGNSMAAGKTELLTHEIRCKAQFENINRNASKENYVYRQTCDINLAGTTYKAPVITSNFAGLYDGATVSGDRYSIVGFKETNNTSNADSYGIFNQIGETGRIRNVKVENGQVSVNSLALTAKNIGILAATCKGEIKNAYVNGVITINHRHKDACIGLLVGRCEEGEGNGVVITKCSSQGDINIQWGNLFSAEVGGLIGQITNGDISNSWSNTTIADSSNIADHVIGGLVGSTVKGKNGTAAGTDITNSYAMTYYSGNKTKNLFIGDANNSMVTYCHGALRDGTGALLTENAEFANSNGSIFAKCYGLATSTTDVNNIDSAENYKILSNFDGFDDTIWKVTLNGQYPSLINNPEP